MFTGLIKDIGIIESVTPNQEGRRFAVKTKLNENINIDDSISINGVCQTAVKVGRTTFEVQAIETTLNKTTLIDLKVGSLVNLELAMSMSDRFGGHFVQGHINEVGLVKKIEKNGESYLLTVSYPDNLKRNIVQEGSIAINGISLTVAYINQSTCTFTLAIIPHTWHNTNLRELKTGDKVNIEVDILSKYVENSLKYNSNNENSVDNSKITRDWLSSRGF